LEQGKQISTAVWRNGARQRNRTGALRVLKKAGSNLDKAVYVFQPRVKKSALKKITGQMHARHLDRSDVRRLQQLNALLLVARGVFRLLQHNLS
jgi:hypothetical protein